MDAVLALIGAAIAVVIQSAIYVYVGISVARAMGVPI